MPPWIPVPGSSKFLRPRCPHKWEVLECAEELVGEPRDGDGPVPHRPSIDLLDENIAIVVWATGFSYDFSWIDFPVRDETGYPVTDRGAASVPGLYFMGLDWMVKRKSGLLYGVADDARHVAAHIAGYLTGP